MRAAVLVFVCVIGVTLALPSFRSKETQIETRLAGLLEKYLGNQKGTRTQHLRSGSDDDDDDDDDDDNNGLNFDCDNVGHPCYQVNSEEEYFECALGTLLTIIPALADIYRVRTEKELFSELENFLLVRYDTLAMIDNVEIQLAKFHIGKYRYGKVDWTGILPEVLDQIQVNACKGMIITHDIYSDGESED